MNIKDIAQLFSIGQFSQIQSYFSEDIVWEIVGERQLSNLAQVLEYCQSLENYFRTVKHEFQIQAIHQSKHHVIIQGTAKFYNSSQTTHISACDVYHFNAENQLTQIQSYCISIP